MKLRALLVFCFITSGTLLAGCGGIFPTPTPTPTATPLPTATATATPTVTATRPRPTATPANPMPPAIAFALNKTQEARSMNFEFESLVTLTQAGQTKKVPGLALKGFDSTLNRQVSISGTTSDTNEFITYEIVVLGADVYIKGLGGNGLNDQQWYKLPEAAQGGVRRLPTARGLIASFSPEDVSKAQFKADGSETLDDETCSVWSAQNPENAQTLIGVTAESDLRKQLGEIDQTEFKMWTCADGYIHLMTGQVQGHSAENKEDLATVTLRFQMNHFEEAFDVQAPTGAIPFPNAPAPATEAPTQVNASATPTAATGATEANPTPTPPEGTDTDLPTATETTETNPSSTPTEPPTPSPSP